MPEPWHILNYRNAWHTPAIKRWVVPRVIKMKRGEKTSGNVINHHPYTKNSRGPSPILSTSNNSCNISYISCNISLHFFTSLISLFLTSSSKSHEDISRECSPFSVPIIGSHHRAPLSVPIGSLSVWGTHHLFQIAGKFPGCLATIV